MCLLAGIDSSTELKLDLKLYDQVWSPSDLNPDRLTNELNKQFILNDTATRMHNNSNLYFNVNSQSASSSQTTASVGGGFPGISLSGSGGSSESFALNNDQTTHNVMSVSDIQHRIGQ
jgi:hypothetical protein